MPDIFSKEKRSWVMSRIRGKGTKVELMLARGLRKSRIHYRSQPKIFGNPDFLVFSGKSQVLVFVDGDFWHGWDYNDRKDRLPEYWQRKIERNMARDKSNTERLQETGWKVVRIWEHQINRDIGNCLKTIAHLLDNN